MIQVKNTADLQKKRAEKPLEVYVLTQSDGSQLVYQPYIDLPLFVPPQGFPPSQVRKNV